MSIVSRFAAILLLVLAPALAESQQRPTPSQAQDLLRTRPELITQLRERIIGSGLTPAQVRARLRAEGYPEDLLDPYLSRTGAVTAAPSIDVFAAVRDLGLADSTDVRELMRLAGLDTGERDSRSEQRRESRAPLADSVALADSTLAPASAEIFGLALFRGSTSQFLPNLDGPVDAAYRLGPGDQLALIITGDVELAHTLTVSREGVIVIPEVGRVAVANLTMSDLQNLLYTRLVRVYGGLRRDGGGTTSFNASVTQLRSNQVFVTGDVITPGSYRVTSAGTAFTALYAAGGPTLRGSLRRVEVRRAGRVVSTLDVYDYLLRGSSEADVRLQQGDVVFVPVHGPRVRLDGEVMRPATYEVKEGERIGDLLAAAGGLRATAGGRRLLVQRVLAQADRTMGRERIVIDVPLGADGSAPALELADGDVVRVPGVSDRVRSGVLVEGHVWSEGTQGFAPGLTLAEALRRAGGLKPDAYLGTVLVSRLQSDSTRIQLRAMLRDTTGATVEPFLLAEDDVVTAYSRTAFRPAQFVAVGGAVAAGGRFPYRQGMTLRDLVLMAGGLSAHAHLREAEIARIPATADARITATTMRVALDSSYRFDLAGPATVPSAPEIPLQPFDNVLILRDPDWREPQSVLLFGEVRFPGRYTLLRRDERLSSVVQRAGGLTPQADADGAYFARVVDRATARELALASAMRETDPQRRELTDSALTARTTNARIDQVRDRIRVGIDLRRALSGRDRSDDLVLVDGDSVHLPPFRQTVSVRGAVNAPTALTHSGGRLAYYLNAAGGPTERARARRAYVIQPNGRIESRRHLFWIFRLDPKPLPGAAVVVPERDEARVPANNLATLSIITQMLASLAAIIAISR